MCGHTTRDRIRNEDIQDKVGVTSVVDKMMKVRHRRFRHMKRKCTNVAVRRCKSLDMVGLRRIKGRSIKYLGEMIRQDMLQVRQDMTHV